MSKRKRISDDLELDDPKRKRTNDSNYVKTGGIEDFLSDLPSELDKDENENYFYHCETPGCNGRAIYGIDGEPDYCQECKTDNMTVSIEKLKRKFIKCQRKHPSFGFLRDTDHPDS